MADFPRCDGTQCAGCPGLYVCHCLKVTEEMVIEAVAIGADSVAELRQLTGAGDGCTACHRRLNDLIDMATRQADGRELVLA